MTWSVILPASRVVATGSPSPAARLSATGAPVPRRMATPSWASVLFAQPTSVGWLCKETIKIFRLRGRAGPRSNPIWVLKEGVRPYVWSRHAVLKALTQPFLRFVVNLKCKRSSGSASGLAVAFFLQKKTFALNRFLQYQ